MFILLFVLIFGFSFLYVAILTSLSDPEFWEGSALFPFFFLFFFRDNALYVVLAIISTITIIINTLSVWTGRIREKFRFFFPWSIYRV